MLHGVQMIRNAGSGLDTALYSVEEKPDDPRSRSYWQPGWIDGARKGTGVIVVDLGEAPAAQPSSMDPRTAEVSVQQLVWALQSALATHAPVRFTRDGRPATRTAPVRGGDAGHLGRWHATFDVRGLASGHYLVVASGPDPRSPSITDTDQQVLVLGGPG